MDNLRSILQSYIGRDAIVWRGDIYSYDTLLNRILYWEKELVFIDPGSIVGLESDFTPETVAILFALVSKKAIVVPLDISHGKKNIQKSEIAGLNFNILVESETEVKISHVSRTGVCNEYYEEIANRHVSGLVLFTSGSSGLPKAAVHDFSKLLSKFSSRRPAFRTVNFLLFDHWGGLNTLFHVLCNGGTVIFLENRRPEYVCALIEKFKVELLPASPTFLKMLLVSRAFELYSLQSLKIISYGAEPMPESLLQSLNKIFPHVRFQQTYGLIELGVLRSQSLDNDSLWVKVGGNGYETRVVDGILQIKAESAMLGYLNAISPFTDDGWFITGDMVEVSGDYYKILGRKSELINVGGEKVFPQEVENVILEIPGINDVLVYSESNPLVGNIVCAKVSSSKNLTRAEVVKLIKQHCRTRLEAFKVPVKIELVDSSFESDRFKKTRLF